MPAYKAHIASLETAFLDTLKRVPGIGDIQIVGSSSQNHLMDYGADIDVIGDLYGFQAFIEDSIQGTLGGLSANESKRRPSPHP